MNCAFCLALLGIALFPLSATQPAQVKAAKSTQTKSSLTKTKSSVTKSSQTKSAKTTPAKPGTTRHKAGARYSRRAPPRPSYQLHPDPERYQQIQQALADRGYFKGQVNGQWGDDSVDALKRFQTDQKLPDDGKISAPALIGLGLGPTHNGSPVTPAAPPPSNSAATTAPANSGERSAAPPPASPPQSAPPPPSTASTPPR